MNKEAISMNKANYVVQAIIEWLFITGVVLAPMTSWRVGKVGPAELCCLMATVLIAYQNYDLKFPSNIIFEFWVLFLPIVLLGSLYCYAFFREESDPKQLVTWVYFSIMSIYLYDWLEKTNSDIIESIGKRIIVLSVVWYTFMYMYHLTVGDTFLGATLMFGGVRFTGGGTNPHQLGLLMSTVAVMSAGSFLEANTWKDRLLFVISFIIANRLVYETQSSTAEMSIVIGLFIVILYSVHNRKLRLAIIFLLLAIVTMFSSRFYNGFMNWVKSDSNGMGRFDIWSTYPITFDKSPFIGLGPGAHAMNGAIEYHNTYIEILAMSGVLGLLVFLAFTAVIFYNVKSNPISISLIISLYAFGLAGFGFRRLVYWTLLSYGLAIAERKSDLY